MFEQLWKASLEVLEYLDTLDLQWQSVDGAMVKAPLGGEKTGRNPTDRGKLGCKRSLHVDGNGLPLGLVIAGANRHDMQLLSETLDAMQLILPEPSAQRPQHLC